MGGGAVSPSPLGSHVRPQPAEALPREPGPRRRAGDQLGDQIRRQAICAVFDGTVDRGERISLATIERLCREYEGAMRNGGWRIRRSALRAYERRRTTA